MTEIRDKYIVTIGLEIHAELKTASKMFCACKNDPDEEKPNINVCPICMGHPGTLPVLNEEAIRNVLRVGVSVNGKIADFTEWDRKHYFYPDIPKGYQLSQYAYPLVSGGELAGVALERIHLEEDTAQSTHDAHEKSLVNFNRSGVPLMELVTKPVIHDAKTAVEFAKQLQLLLRYLGAGEANMEKGEMRVEANISVSKTEAVFGTKTEVKNLNSFRAVQGAIEYEIDRQIDKIEKGEVVVQETRGWDDNNKETYSQRSKESAHDYRYFPEPDIPKMKISDIPEFSISSIQKTLPELPWIKRDRYLKDYSMTEKEVSVFIDSPVLSNYFDEVINSRNSDSKFIRLTINYLLTDYLGLLKKEFGEVLYISKVGNISAKNFSELIGMIAQNELGSRGAKEVLSIMYKEGGQASFIAKDKGLIQKSDEGALKAIVEAVLSANEGVVNEYKAGKQASLQFLIGQTMKASKGSGNPEILKKIILDKISV